MTTTHERPALGGAGCWRLAWLVMALAAPSGVTRAQVLASRESQSVIAIRSDGKPMMLGTDSIASNVPPQAAPARAVEIHANLGLSVTEAGHLVSWGNNSTAPGYALPPAIAAAADIKQVAVGTDFAVALRENGTVVAWGTNGQGLSVPANLSGVVKIVAHADRAYAIRADGTVVAWGSFPSSYGPMLPAGLTGIVDLAACLTTQVAVKSDGTVVAWGSSSAGTPQIVPPGLDHVVQVAVAQNIAAALRADGSVTVWGVPANDPYGLANVPAIQDGVAIAVTSYNGYVLRANGKLVVWGENRTGNGSAEAATTLFRIPYRNAPPLAGAGLDMAILGSEQGGATVLGAAFDPDGDPLNYRWLEGPAVLQDWRPLGPGEPCSLALGSLPPFSLADHRLTLEVTDGINPPVTSSMTLSVGNTAPTAAATGSGTYPFGSAVTLGGTASDFDGDLLTFEWREGDAWIGGGTLAVPGGGEPRPLPPVVAAGLAPGSHSFTLQVQDNVNPPVVATVQAEILPGDLQAPTLAPVADRTVLWPPNGTMVPVTIRANASDNSGAAPALTVAVTCNEPLRGSPYWTEPVIDQATGTIRLDLKADRLGKGDGRFYTITITATDAAGNSSHASLVVAVPHDEGRLKDRLRRLLERWRDHQASGDCRPFDPDQDD